MAPAKPNAFPVKFVLMFLVGLLFTMFGLYNFFTGVTIDVDQMLKDMSPTSIEDIDSAQPALVSEDVDDSSVFAELVRFIVDWIWAITLAIGMIMIYYSVVNLWSKLK